MTNRLYDDSTLMEFKATVLECIPEEDTYWIVLDQTAFYVESGGMNSDTGSLNAQPVLELKTKEGKVYHRVQQPISKEVIGIIDINQRLVKTQIHSAQHVLSAIIKKHFKAATTSHHVLAEGADVEVTLESLNEEQLFFIQAEANRIIQEDLLISIEYPDINRTDYRVVTIGDFEGDPCGCLHVPSTALIKNILITGYYKVKKGIRLEYLAGEQIIAYLQSRLPILKKLATELSLPDSELLDGIDKLKEQQKELRTKLNKRTDQYLNLIVENTLSNKNLSKINYIIQEFDTLDLKELQALANHYTQHENVIVFLQAKVIEKGYLIIAKNKKIDLFHANQILDYFKNEYEYRGGGNEFSAQGNGLYITNFEEQVKKLI